MTYRHVTLALERSDRSSHAGTVLDHTVTHLTELAFFLQSHVGLKHHGITFQLQVLLAQRAHSQHCGVQARCWTTR